MATVGKSAEFARPGGLRQPTKLEMMASLLRAPTRAPEHPNGGCPAASPPLSIPARFMDLHPLVKGTIIGFAIAAPVGPVGVLCIRRALADGRLAAFVAGLGAAVADTFYGAVAAWGLTLVTDFLMQHRMALSLGGGAFLVYLGWRTFRARSELLPTPETHIGLMRDFVSTFLITLTNPATILAFMAVFASVSAVHVRNPVSLDTTLLILGVFFGSAAWWGVLSAAASAVRSHFTPLWLRWLNRGSGIVLALFGIGVLISVVF